MLTKTGSLLVRTRWGRWNYTLRAIPPQGRAGRLAGRRGEKRKAGTFQPVPGAMFAAMCTLSVPGIPAYSLEDTSSQSQQRHEEFLRSKTGLAASLRLKRSSLLTWLSTLHTAPEPLEPCH
jgi:hypothetical protein